MRKNCLSSSQNTITHPLIRTLIHVDTVNTQKQKTFINEDATILSLEAVVILHGKKEGGGKEEGESEREREAMKGNRTCRGSQGSRWSGKGTEEDGGR